MAKYRKKPIVIDAWQWCPNTDELYMSGWIVSELMDAKIDWSINKKRELGIKTLEGTMTTSDGDWIIKGVNGEFYPCKPDIFEKTYELVDDKTDVLDLEFRCDSFQDKTTVREYFTELLRRLWVEGASFSAKRPFGYSDWQFDIYAALVKYGYVDGKLDEGGYVEEVDGEKADEFIVSQIINRL